MSFTSNIQQIIKVNQTTQTVTLFSLDQKTYYKTAVSPLSFLSIGLVFPLLFSLVLHCILLGSLAFGC